MLLKGLEVSKSSLQPHSISSVVLDTLQFGTCNACSWLCCPLSRALTFSVGLPVVPTEGYGSEHELAADGYDFLGDAAIAVGSAGPDHTATCARLTQPLRGSRGSRRKQRLRH